MKKYISLLAACCLFVPAGLRAQSTSSLWMLDNNVYGYRYNAAYIPEKSFLGLGVGAVSANVSTDLGLANLVFPTSDGLVTGLNSAVSADDFLGSMKDLNRIKLDINENILAIGARGRKGGYSTVELGIRANGFVDIPKSLFAMFKEGGSNVYDLSALNAAANAYVELSYGFASHIGDYVSLGVRLKGLCGLASLRTDIVSATVSSNANALSMQAEATIKAAAPYMVVGTTESEYQSGVDDVIDFENITVDASKIRPAGAGAAVDIGLIFEPMDWLSIGISVNDLGVMGWNYGIKGSTDASVVYTGSKYESNYGDGSVSDDADGMLSTLEQLGEFRNGEGDGKWEWGMLPYSVNASLKLRMPFYKRLSVDAMGTYCNYYGRSSYDLRGALNITPLDWFSIGGNAGLSDYGPVWGAATSINLTILNIWLAMDGYIGKYATWTPEGSKFGVPYPINPFGCGLSAGVTFFFGKRVPAVSDRLNMPKAEKKALRAERRAARLAAK